MNPNGGDKQVLNTGKNAPKHMNKFPDLKYKFACPERFGELSPCFMYNGLALDRNVTLHTGSSVDSMSLHAPILQDVKKNIDYYIVDKKAILPHTFEYIKNLPTHGDDIDASKANCLITPYTGTDYDLWAVLKTFVISNEDYFAVSEFNDDQFNFFLRGLVILNGLFAGDSLLESFRIPLARICSSRKRVNVVLNRYWALFHHLLDKMGSYDNPDVTNVDFRDSEGDVVLRKSYFFNDIKDRMRFFYDYVENSYCTTDLDASDWEEVITDVIDSSEYTEFAEYFIQPTSNALKSAIMGNSNSLKPINIENVIAYQLICAEYHTNDKVDWIYSANLYRMLFEAYAFSSALTYQFNGMTLPYDGFSAITLSTIFYRFYGSVDFADASIAIPELNLIVSLFYRKLSLRYVDRFVGAKPLPLANGDSNIVVNDGVASVIDVTQKIQLMRFRMAVNRVGRKAKNYLRGIFNSEERVDVTCPVFVGHIDYMLYKNETQNTADSQLELDNSRTATINAGAKKYGFSCDIDEDSLIIGISSYEITRFYDESLDPFAMKVDRYDMFNPFMQYTGDQAIPMNQLDAGLPSDDIFAYETKDQEYKVSTDYCIGDFRDSLSGWIFRQEHIDRDTYISPDFIRAHQYELDKYYLALTGTIPEKRYHFICKYSNYVTALRNMVKVPQILNA